MLMYLHSTQVQSVHVYRTHMLTSGATRARYYVLLYLHSAQVQVVHVYNNVSRENLNSYLRRHGNYRAEHRPEFRLPMPVIFIFYFIFSLLSCRDQPEFRLPRPDTSSQKAMP